MSAIGTQSDAPPLHEGYFPKRKPRHSDKSKSTTSLQTVSHAVRSRTKSGRGRSHSLSVQLAQQHTIQPGGTPCQICKRSLSYGGAMERVCKCQLGRSCVHDTSQWQHLVCPTSPRPLVMAGPSFRALNRARKPMRAPCGLAARASTSPAATPSAAAVPCGVARLPTPLRDDATMASVQSAFPTTPVQRPTVLPIIARSKPRRSLTQSPDELLAWPQRQKRSSRTRRGSVLQLEAHSTTAEATATSKTIRKRKRPHGRGTPKFCKACRQPMKGHSTLSCAGTNA